MDYSDSAAFGQLRLSESPSVTGSVYYTVYLVALTSSEQVALYF